MPCSVLPPATVVTPERVYLAPHAQLRGSISHYTVYTPNQETAPGVLTVVPDASGSIVCRLTSGQEGQCIETRFWGPSSRAVVVESHPARYPCYIMVEFLPCGANRLLGIPMDELRNAIMPLHTLHPPLHQALVEAMERLATRPRHSAGAVCASLDATFLRLLSPNAEADLARQVLSEVRRTNGTLRIAELSRRVGCSPRQLGRLMTERLGMPVKSLARIIRINAACRCMDAQATSLTELAHALHYHDQSHFIHDFTDICGVTPGEYLSRLSHFYNEELKLGGMLPSK